MKYVVIDSVTISGGPRRKVLVGALINQYINVLVALPGHDATSAAVGMNQFMRQGDERRALNGLDMPGRSEIHGHHSPTIPVDAAACTGA